MTTLTIVSTPLSTVDELGLLKAQIADLTKKAETSRSFIDADLARKFLTEKQLAKITKTCGTVSVRVTARKAA